VAALQSWATHHTSHGQTRVTAQAHELLQVMHGLAKAQQGLATMNAGRLGAAQGGADRA